MSAWVSELVETKTVDFFMPDIVGKQRPRFDSRSRKTYTPKKTEKAEAFVRDAWTRKCGSSRGNFDGEVHVRVEYSRELSKSNPKYWLGRADLRKPDIDNFAKLCLDALCGKAWMDDKQVTELTVRRLPMTKFGTGNFVRITVEYFREGREDIAGRKR